MKSINRRQMLLRSTTCVAVIALGRSSIVQAQGAEGRVIEIVAQRFSFTPNEISVKRGEVVTLAIRSMDFVHGFNLPAFNMRFDLPPGQVTRIRLEPKQSGQFDFLCDNFCGEGHEKMHGRIVVHD